ncbi:glucoamylase family protein [Agrococcus jejuensis]|uniref:Putative glucoamylase n=1 Tax=Agrococcus jejuensis TaxID=399736 RepID=A0A1G8BDC8_9MICO|nr:glucoamylase family protein [Agrococcus jejuensis]SDH31188.1 Putative glucoamylase [Agrococcus jejuensis]
MPLPTSPSDSFGVSRRGFMVGGLAAAATVAFGAATPASASPLVAHGGSGHGFSGRRARRWAQDTWTSLVAMTDETTGLPADNVLGDLSGRSGYTSPTNIGGLLWSGVVARELGIVSRRDLDALATRTLETVLQVEHHEPSGMLYNWYSEATGEALRTWPDSGDPVYRFASSVDNAWLGAAMRVVMSAIPGRPAELARQVWERMRWDAFYNPGTGAEHPTVRPGGLMHGGFFVDEHDRPGEVYQGSHIGGDPVWLSNHHYDTFVSETRMTSYLGIVAGQVPAAHYYAAWRTFPGGDDWAWQESRPVGVSRTYQGIEVFEGAYEYRGMRIVPGWGGSMFEELMPDLFVPEASWGRRSWGRNHPLHVRAQREHGLDEAGYGVWGFSPSSDPFGGYREYGVDRLGMNPDGYLSDRESTNVDAGYAGVREGTNPTPDFGDGVVTPHAAMLAMSYERDAAFANLARIEDELGAYGPGGFLDAVSASGVVADRHLSLDQAMCMGALGSVLGGGVVQRAFATRQVRDALHPLMRAEEFGAA